MTTHQGFTATASGLALLAALGIWTWGRARWPRLTVLLILAGVGGLATTTAGQWGHRGMTAAADAVGKLTGYLFGFVFIGLPALAAVVFVAFHLHHKSISKKTLGAAAVVPVSVSLIPGAAGAVLVSLTGLLTTAFGEVAYLMFNGHL